MEIVASHAPEFELWGRRDYVHGSTMAGGMFEAAEHFGIGPVRAFDATFRGKLREDGDYLLLDGATDVDLAEFPAVFRVDTEGGRRLVVVRGNGRPVPGFLEDDEARLVSAANMDQAAKTVALDAYPRERFYAVITALTKTLHKELYESVEGSQWFLARLSLSMEAAGGKIGGGLAVVAERIIGGKMTKNRIELAGEPVGSVFFHRGQGA